MRHTSACFYGADGLCIWCRSSTPATQAKSFPATRLAPAPSLGPRPRSFVPAPLRSQWAREQARRTAQLNGARTILQLLEEEVERAEHRR